MKTINVEQIQQINLFENITKARVKELLINEETYIFIVEQGDASKAIGKQGSNIARISNMFRKRIKIVEFNPEIKYFINNLFSPLKPQIKITDSLVEVTADTKTKGLLIGRDKRNLNIYKGVLKEYFNKDLIIK